jgi:hypothetical protein
MTNPEAQIVNGVLQGVLRRLVLFRAQILGLECTAPPPLLNKKYERCSVQVFAAVVDEVIVFVLVASPCDG